jgi:hypothetical protein
VYLKVQELVLKESNLTSMGYHSQLHLAELKVKPAGHSFEAHSHLQVSGFANTFEP